MLEVGTLALAQVSNMSASVFRLLVCSLPKVGKGEAGAGLRIVWMRSRMAWIACSCDDIFGMSYTVGKNSTVSEYLVPLVDGM